MTAGQRSQVTGYRRPRYQFASAGNMIRAALWALALGAAVGLALVAQGAHRARSLARVERMAEEWHRLPGGLLSRLRGYERGHLDMDAARPRGAAACGRYQIYVRARQSPDGERLCAMAQSPTGAWMAAQLLAESRRWCARNPGRCECPWQNYNSGDAARLCRALGEEDRT